MQAGQDLGVVVAVQADAAHQELLVYLPHHGAARSALMLGHGGSTHPEPRGTAARPLQGERERERERRGRERGREGGREGGRERVSERGGNVNDGFRDTCGDWWCN